MTAKAEFRITSWDEHAYAEFDAGRKLAQANTTQDYNGDLAGTGTTTMLLYYGAADAPVYYTSAEHFTGTLHGRTGTFVAQGKGTFADGVADTAWFIVPGSGTGELAGLRGDGTATAVRGEQSVPVTVDYQLQG
jgi:hypothetical protein